MSRGLRKINRGIFPAPASETQVIAPDAFSACRRDEVPAHRSLYPPNRPEALKDIGDSDPLLEEKL